MVFLQKFIVRLLIGFSVGCFLNRCFGIQTVRTLGYQVNDTVFFFRYFGSCLRFAQQ